MHEGNILIFFDSDHSIISALYFRLVPKFFFASDSPQQDPVLAVASDQTRDLLSPIMEPVMAGQLPPLVQGLMKPYHFDILAEVCPATESSLSRVVQTLFHTLLVSHSKYATVSRCTFQVFISI